MHIVVVESVAPVHLWQVLHSKVNLRAGDGMDPSIQPIPFGFWVTAYSAQPGLERDMRKLKQCIVRVKVRE